MEIGDFLGGVGLFLCIGAIILVAVVAFAFRALTRRSPDRDNVFDERGEAVPRYDDRDVRTGGGFGEIPTTGTEYDRDVERRTGMDRETDYDRDIDLDPRDEPSSSFGGPPPRRDTPRRDEPRRRDEDDDDIRSGGGFGT
ncbi:MAG: hypothetical protein GX491_00730 [Chloroflexi bacterium]|nr:hypothetical protein [Chloroflexota bacterium]